jgi:hypothetical protein
MGGHIGRNLAHARVVRTTVGQDYGGFRHIGNPYGSSSTPQHLPFHRPEQAASVEDPVVTVFHRVWMSLWMT